MLKTVLLSVLLTITMGCATQSQTRVICSDAGPIMYEHEPGLRVVENAASCIRFGKGTTLQTENAIIELGPGTVIFSTGTQTRGISAGAVSGIGLLGGALGLAATGGNPLGGAAGVALGEAVNAIPKVIDMIMGSDEEEEVVVEEEEVVVEEEVVEPEEVDPVKFEPEASVTPLLTIEQVEASWTEPSKYFVYNKWKTNEF